MNARELKGRIVPVLLAGTRREAVPDVAGLQVGTQLDMLSLAGQALRFESPHRPAQFDVDAWPPDTRRILPESVRPKMLRLLNASRCTEGCELAIALACMRGRLRPHPFDLPRVEGFVRRHCQYLGVVAQYWAQRQTKADNRRGYFDAEATTLENWTDAPIAARVAYLARLREQHAPDARAALEQVWSRESVEARFRLIAAMQTGLGNEDRVFLETALKDRAPRVRAVARRLLARLSGSAANNPALAACLKRIRKEKAGLLERCIVLRIELPANVKEQTANRWIRDQFADVTLEELSCTLEIPVADLAAAAKDDPNLLFALAMVASVDRRFDLVAGIAKQLPDAWGRMSEAGFDDLAFVDDVQRRRWVESIVRPRDWMPEPPLPAWGWLLRQIEAPLPVNLMRELLRSKWWSDQLAGGKPPDTEVVQVFCALCPAALRDRMREAIEGLDFDRKELGWMLLETLDRLEAVR